VFDFPALGLSELDRLDLVTEENKSPLYNEIKQYVSQTIQLAALEKPLVLSLGEKLVGRIMDSLDEGSELLVDGLDRRQAFSVSAHSVNVSILALKLAMSSDKDRAFCVRVGLAGLLHEIGVVKLPERLLYKEAPLSQAELQLLRERPLLSSEALRSVDREFGYLSGIVSQVLERRNGSGYPLALREEEIKPEACFLGISDFFEAFVHKRPYRKVLTGYQAFRELTTDESQRFGQEYVRALVESLSLYPYGEIVLLSDGRLAKVVEINPLDLSRPIVQIMKSGSVNECPTLNLSEENLRINRAVSAESIEPI
jgi:HD-GYP domain-containing protein (c-di-GMP phosphodiesterase class II)